MKIIYNIPATSNSGGMERVLSEKTSWLASRKSEDGSPLYDILVVTTDQRGKGHFFPMHERVRTVDLGIDYDVNNEGTFLDKLLHYPFKKLLHRHRLTQLLKREKADIVISMFGNEASFVPSIKDGSRKVLEIHFSRFKQLQFGRSGLWGVADRLRNAGYPKLAGAYDAFVVLTEEDRGYWGDMKNIHVIPNSRTFVFDAPAVLENRTVLAVGRYSYQKALDRLVDAWKKVRSSECADGWTLRIVGDGPLRGELQDKISSEGLDGSIVLGNTTKDIRSVYSESSMLVLSSRYEGLPMVLLEAQAAGLPAISFACKCGPRDVITDGVDGFLVEEGDIDGLADRILTLISDESLRRSMGNAAFKASERFDKESVMLKWKDLFERL